VKTVNRPGKELQTENPVVTGKQEELKGLCMNCEARDYCRIRKPEGGIWHCEEYK
jgi:hypothetical protein